MIKKMLLIGLALATTLGVGFYLYTKSKPAPEDEEMFVATQPPTTERAAPMPAEVATQLSQAETAEPLAPSDPQDNIKAASGHFEMSRPHAPDELDPADNPGYGKAREKRLWEIFTSDRNLVRSVRVKKIQCRVDTCIIEAESKDANADRFQSLMFALTKQYPWLGNKIDVTTPEDNPQTARFIYFQEIPK